MNFLKSYTLFAVSAAVLCAGTAKAQYALNTLVGTFNGVTAATPLGSLIADANGNLYGTTRDAGQFGGGTLFEVPAGTHTLNILASFDKFNGTVGALPVAGLIADASGNLYGTTIAGGSNGKGTVFELAAGTHSLTTLVSFDGMNGANPWCSLIADARGNLFGTTYSGGANNVGTVFEVASSTHSLITLATFNTANGANPHAGLIADNNGNLYGTTEGGGAHGAGTVFKVAAGTQTLSTLATFNFNDAYGANPEAGLIADTSGNLYGTTSYGGLGSSKSGPPHSGGTVFEVAVGTNILSTLATFNDTNGANPYGGLIADADGNLYGTTLRGGANDNGTAFKVAANTHLLSTIANFVQDGATGVYPYAGLIADANGNLYGTTEGGGLNGNGTVFELSPISLHGDFNRDGHVDAGDISSMMVALTDLHGYESAKGLTDPQFLAFGDLNGDGNISNADLRALLNLLKSGGGSTAAVPEPSSLALGLLALASLPLLGRGSEVLGNNRRLATWKQVHEQLI